MEDTNIDEVYKKQASRSLQKNKINVNCYFLSCILTEHLWVLKKTFKRVRAFPMELEFERFGFEEREKPEYLKKTLSEKRREPITNSTHIWGRSQDRI